MKVGDWVEVRSEAEILHTLDDKGQLDGVPFMPEMYPYCGQRLQIYRCAHKTCDGIARRSRRLTRTVHLDTRCSGEAHGGCQAGCLLYWKESWLRPIHAGTPDAGTHSSDQSGYDASLVVSKEAVAGFTVVHEGDTVRFQCQATQIRDAGSCLPWWDVRQYVKDLRSGNVDAWTFVCGTLRSCWMIMSRGRFGTGRLTRWIYDHLRHLWRGEVFPRRVGRILRGHPTPMETLNLKPGELVHVRSLTEIDETLDTWGQNRGLYFDPEQAPYTNHVFRVRNRVERMINEETGRMIELRTPTVSLDSVVCQGRHSSCRMFCPKSAYLLWREVWLKRVTENMLR